MKKIFDNRSDIEIVLDGNDKEYRDMMRSRKGFIVLTLIYSVFGLLYAVSYGLFDYDPINWLNQKHAGWLLLLLISAGCYMSARTTMDELKGFKKYRKSD